VPTVEGNMLKTTYVCDICGELQKTVEYGGVKKGNLGIPTSLTGEKKEDIIKYSEVQGILVYTLCPLCLEEAT